MSNLFVVRKVQLSWRLSRSCGAACSNRSTAQEINLNSYRMGNAYASTFCESFSLVLGVESLNLAHNRIGDDVAAQIITHAANSRPSSIQHLNMTHNKLSTPLSP